MAACRTSETEVLDQRLCLCLSYLCICHVCSKIQPVRIGLFLSLRYGRRSVLIWSYLQLAVLGCSAALSPSYTAYCIFRFLGGMAVSGVILNGVSLSTSLSLLLFVYLCTCLPVCLSGPTQINVQMHLGYWRLKQTMSCLLPVNCLCSLDDNRHCYFLVKTIKQTYISHNVFSLHDMHFSESRF